MFRIPLVIALVLAVAGLATTAALAATPPGGVTTKETVDLDAFAQGIKSRLQGNVVGFSYAIARNGAVVRSGAGGYRKLPQAGGSGSLAERPAPFTPDTLAQAASASKTITAAALIKALHERGLSVDTRIGRYLPRCWKKGPGVSNLTFRDVLGHHTLLPAGTNCATNPLGCLLESVAKGRDTFPEGDVPWRYSNTAYALVRVLLPFVRDRAGMQAAFGLSTARCASDLAELNELVSTRFRDYVLGQVLRPLGVTASFYPQGDGIEDFAYVYNRANLAQPAGGPGEDFYLRAGPGYLAISAKGYARFLSALDAGLIVPKALANQMKGVPGNRMGFDTSIPGALGEYVWKNGGCPSDKGKKPGCSTLGMVFPNGMQAYVATNSSNNSCGRLDVLLRDAFDEALR